jgi:hypothetical protein
MAAQFQWREPNRSELAKFLVDENGFDGDRLSSSLDRVVKGLKLKNQQRLDAFFQVQETEEMRAKREEKAKLKRELAAAEAKKQKAIVKKRKAEEKEEAEKESQSQNQSQSKGKRGKKSKSTEEKSYLIRLPVDQQAKQGRSQGHSKSQPEQQSDSHDTPESQVKSRQQKEEISPKDSAADDHDAEAEEEWALQAPLFVDDEIVEEDEMPMLEYAPQ